VLTKDLLQYRILKGQVRPRFIDPAGVACAVPAVGMGSDRASLEEQLAACHAGFQPQNAIGDSLIIPTI
jgi:predicted nuclease of restriction endonuclease-like RecB superfamily